MLTSNPEIPSRPELIAIQKGLFIVEQNRIARENSDLHLDGKLIQVPFKLSLGSV
jgi:hypothetical protein